MHPDITPVSGKVILKAKRAAKLSNFFALGFWPKCFQVILGVLGGIMAGFWGGIQGYGVFALLLGVIAWPVYDNMFKFLRLELSNHYAARANAIPLVDKINEPIDALYFGELDLILEIHPRWVDEVADWAVRNGGSLRYRHLIELRRRLGMPQDELSNSSMSTCMIFASKTGLGAYRDMVWGDVANGALEASSSRHKINLSSPQTITKGTARRL